MQNDLLTTFLSGGLITALIGLFTLRSQIRKVRGEAHHLDLENTREATHILIENIVEPLKADLHETRKEFTATKKEMLLLRHAIHAANSCDYRLTCPVLKRLREHPKNECGTDE